VLGDVARIARSVRDVVGARASIVSRVIDDAWLEILEVSGEPSERDLVGARWRRADLERLLERGERLGRVHLTVRETVSYVEVPHDERPHPGDAGLLLAPLFTPGGDLVGVLATEGSSFDPADPPPGTCELVELYADQARLALHALRDHQVLAERLRLVEATQALLDECARQEDVATLMTTVVTGLTETFRAGGAWACLEVAPGAHGDTAAYPDRVGEVLGADICTLLDPVVEQCRRDGTARTAATSPVLARIARVTGHDHVLLAAIGLGDEPRGAMLLLRTDDDPWDAGQNQALADLGRRLGTVGGHLVARRRDQEVTERLRELDRYRRDLVASLTHDLKTPLTAIALNTELLESDRRVAEAVASPVSAIRRSAERLTRLVDDLLMLARAEEGAVSARSRVGDVAEVLREACRHAAEEARVRGITFEVDAPEQLMAQVDVDALARVYTNVVGNAVKFSLAEGVVRLVLRRDGDMVELSCSDDGIGIAAEDHAAVFDMFRRSSDPEALALPGSGIGLAISQRIVTRLGGTIGLVSSPGDGSTFTIRVPG
jgi:signal transduction histidine kinase